MKRWLAIFLSLILGVSYLSGVNLSYAGYIDIESRIYILKHEIAREARLIKALKKRYLSILSRKRKIGSSTKVRDYNFLRDVVIEQCLNELERRYGVNKYG